MAVVTSPAHPVVRHLTQDLRDEEKLHLAPKPCAGELPSLHTCDFVFETDQFAPSPSDSSQRLYSFSVTLQTGAPEKGLKQRFVFATRLSKYCFNYQIPK